MVEQVSGGKGIRYTYSIVKGQGAKATALAILITPEDSPTTA